MLAIFFTPPGRQLRPFARAGHGSQPEIACPPPNDLGGILRSYEEMGARPCPSSEQMTGQ